MTNKSISKLREILLKLEIGIKQLKLWQVWVMFVIFLLVYIVYSYKFYNVTTFQITTTLITIAIIALTMYTSNKELHKTSEKQITTFEHSIEKLAGSVNNFQRFLETQRDERIRQDETRSARATPNIYVIGNLHKGWFLSDCILDVENKGGYASEIKLVLGTINKLVSVSDLGRNMFIKGVNCGRINEYGGTTVEIKMYLNDELGRKYFADFNLDFEKNE
jgi:hypothetical protein